MDAIPGSSYGDGYAGAADFDLVEFVKRPTTICRFVCILFAIVVFGCISSAGYDPTFHHCIYNKNQDACHYGVATGVLAFLACLLFLCVDAQFSSITNDLTRKQLVAADLFFSGIWTFLWFVGFCFLADQWRKSSIKSQNQTNNARTAIAFSFFSVISWVTLTLMAMYRYRQAGFQNIGGSSTSRSSEYQYGDSKSPYASFPQPSEEESVPVYNTQHTQQPFGVPDQPFGVPPPQPFGVPPTQPFGVPSQPPAATEYNVPGY